MKLSKRIYSELEKIDGNIGVYFEDIQTNEIIEINPNMSFPAASTIKIPLVLLALKDISQGKYSFDDKVDITDRNRVGGTGILKELDVSYKPTIKDHIVCTIIASDNISTNVLIDMTGGPDRINDFIKNELFLNNTKLQRKMLDIEAMKQGKDNITTAGDLGKVLAMLARGEAVSKEASDIVIDIMKAQQHRSKLPAMIPAVPSYDPKVKVDNVEPGSVVVANKTGDLWKVQNDMGVFILPDNKKYVVAILSKDLDSDYSGIEMIGKVSKIIYEEMAEKYDK